MHDVMHEMSHKKLGMTCVVDDEQRLIGIVTDGDLRRWMLKSSGFLQLTAADVMTTDPITVRRDTLAAEALHVLEQRKITCVVVVDEGQQVQGVVHLHDLWRTEMI